MTRRKMEPHPAADSRDDAEPPSVFRRFKNILIGRKRSVEDPKVFHHLSLIAFLAWVGLGADGLSSSSYGPEEAFKALGSNVYLAPALALATAFTVLIISAGYSRVIEHFPFGGGGYVVASKLLGAGAGVVSGSALIIDYVLTITVSVAAGAEAIFSFIPPELQGAKLLVELVAILLLVILNLRGVKESVSLLAPVFVTFLIAHAVLIGGSLLSRISQLGALTHQVHHGYQTGFTTLGVGGMLALFLRAYSMGGGTYTGIEAVSNGLTIMRAPKVQTGKRTMVLMAVSLALTAGGITLAYLLLNVAPEQGKTMNAVLAERFAGSFHLLGIPVGKGFVRITLISEALLLFVAAQAGFLDGPRVMANMATDSWLPHRFAQLSDRLVTQNGIVLMGGASIVALVATGGDVTALVVLYSINVFVTFSLSQAAMCRFWFRSSDPKRWRKGAIHWVGLVLCVGILGVTIYEKFNDGGWATLVLTGILVGICFLIRAHYHNVQKNLRRLDDILPLLPSEPRAPVAVQPTQPTAVLLVSAYAGLGVHQLLTVQRLFPGHFKNVVFISVGVIDSASFHDVAEVEEVRRHTQESLDQYVQLAHRLGMAAEGRMRVGTEAVETAEALCREIAKDYPRALFFAGKLIFQKPQWFQRLLHNETAYAIQRRLQFDGLNAMVLPVRVLENATV